MKKESILAVIKTYKNNGFAEGGKRKSLLSIFGEMIYFRLKYNLSIVEYLNNKFYSFSSSEKKAAIVLLADKKNYIKKRNENWHFLVKYSGMEYQKNNKSMQKRRNAYIRQYGMGKKCVVQYGVTFIFDHRNIGKLEIGESVLFARNVDVDITGDLTIRNGVKISEGAKILTHNHDFLGTYTDEDLIPFSNRAHVTPLVIGENVLIGAHAIIMPNVKTIGDNAVISAGSVVVHPVPANTVVSGNPATVVGKIPKSLRVSTEQFKEDSFAAQMKVLLNKKDEKCGS